MKFTQSCWASQAFIIQGILNLALYNSNAPIVYALTHRSHSRLSIMFVGQHSVSRKATLKLRSEICEERKEGECSVHCSRYKAGLRSNLIPMPCGLLHSC